MATFELGFEKFKEIALADGITLIDFWADWCGPCRMFGPIFEDVSEANPDIKFAKVDTEAEQQLAGDLGISSIPTLMIFRDGVLLYREAGALPEEALTDIVSQVRALDMTDIKREISEATETETEK
ncbi:MAG: thioredoxin [Actinomycetes bacterium]